jgi:adhesin transport system outer membrane protein
MPRLDLQARKNLGTSSDGRNSISAADVLELTMNFNLFNGFADQNLVKQTAEKLNGSRDLRDKACVDTRQIVSIAYNDIAQLKEQQIYRERHTNSIENAREAYRKQFDIGQRTLLDLLDTENEYFQAKRNLANAQYDLQIAYARVYAGQGELLKKIGTSRGNLPEYSREEYMNAETVCQAVAPVQIQVDKAALLADAKPLSNTYVSLAKPFSKLEQTASVTASCDTSAVSTRVNDWANTWRNKDAEGHMKFYADKFTPEPPLSKPEWVKQRKQSLSTSSKVAFQLEGLQVSCEGGKASAKFIQNFALSSGKQNNANVNYASKVIKELQFEIIDNKWQITREQVHN